MTDKPERPKGQLLTRIALVGMVLLAILAGIGLAHKHPPEKPEFNNLGEATDKRPAAVRAAEYTAHMLALDAGLAKDRAAFETTVRTGLKTNDPNLVQRGLEQFGTALELVVYDEAEPLALPDCGPDPAKRFAQAYKTLVDEGKAGQELLARYDEAEETNSGDQTFLAILGDTRAMDADRARLPLLIAKAEQALAAECPQAG
jgi:hypothetical protein